MSKPQPTTISQDEAIAQCDGYRLRMLYGQWYVRLYKENQHKFDLGPYGYNIAQTIAGRSGLNDLDRLTAEQERARG